MKTQLIAAYTFKLLDPEIPDQSAVIDSYKKLIHTMQTILYSFLHPDSTDLQELDLEEDLHYDPIMEAERQRYQEQINHLEETIDEMKEIV